MDCTNEIISIANSVGVDLSGCDNQTDLFEEGVIDSLQIALMVSEIEKRYGIVFNIEDINPDVFLNIDSLAAFVDGKITR